MAGCAPRCGGDRAAPLQGAYLFMDTLTQGIPAEPGKPCPQGIPAEPGKPWASAARGARQAPRATLWRVGGQTCECAGGFRLRGMSPRAMLWRVGGCGCMGGQMPVCGDVQRSHVGHGSHGDVEMRAGVVRERPATQGGGCGSRGDVEIWPGVIRVRPATQGGGMCFAWVCGNADRRGLRAPCNAGRNA